MAVIGSILGTVGSSIASGASAAGGAIASGASAAGGAIASGASAAGSAIASGASAVGGAIAAGAGKAGAAIGELAAKGAESSFVKGAADGQLSSGKSAIVRDAGGGIQWGETAEKFIGNAAGSAQQRKIRESDSGNAVYGALNANEAAYTLLKDLNGRS